MYSVFKSRSLYFFAGAFLAVMSTLPACFPSLAGPFFGHLVLREGYSKRDTPAQAFFGKDLYMAEGEGLFRFDGRGMKQVTSALWPQKTGFIRFLDGGARLWIAADGGFFSFDGKVCKDHSRARGYDGRAPVVVREGPGKKIIVVTDRSLLLGFYYNHELVFSPIDPPTGGGFSFSSVDDAAFLQTGIWLAASSGAYEYTGEGWRHHARSAGLPFEGLRFVSRGPGGTVWVGGYDLLGRGVASWNGANWSVVEGFSQSRPESMDFDGTVAWVATDRGLMRFDGKAVVTYGLAEGLISQKTDSVRVSERHVAVRTVSKNHSVLNLMDKMADFESEDEADAKF